VRLAGVCATDLQLIAGYKGGRRGVLGHEFVGDVIAAPAAPSWIGKRVVGEINVGCGDCGLCRRGLGKHCRARHSLGIIGPGGAFAELLTLPIANLHEVPPCVSDEQAVFVEPLAAALELPTQVHLTPSMRVVVVGDGRLGLLIAQVLALSGCDLCVIGRHADKLALVQAMGMVTLQVGEVGDDQSNLRDADLVVEATGTSGGFALARALVRPGGVLALKSTYAGASMAVNLSDLVVDEITVIGSRCGPFAPALRLLAMGRVRPESLIHARYALADGVAALAHAGQRGVLKVLIAP
jgi:threonine dehydrogenase-like Zn-dependent dehydrogenase